MNLEKFSEIIEGFLKENTVQMILTMPEGTLNVEVEDNTKLGSIVQFYILLNSIKPICRAMRKDMEVYKTSTEWKKVTDTLLDMIKIVMTEEEEAANGN